MASETKLSTRLARLEGGAELIDITRGGKVVARPEPFDHANARVRGQLRGQTWMADDFDGLPPDVAAAIEATPG